MIPVVLDTDIGGDVDDVIALVLCALHPGIDLRCVTTVNGDTGRRARLARALLDLLGSGDVPVGAGASVGLSGRDNASMPAELNHGGALIEATEAAAEPAADLVVRVLEQASSPVEICAIGALTNVAATLAARPDLHDRVAGVHVMGGCLGPVSYGDAGSGGEGDPLAEYNLGCDPLAAAVLWGLPLPLRLVPLDVTMPLVLTDGDRAAISCAGRHGPVLDALAEEYLAATRASGRHAPEHVAIRLHDPLAVVGLVVPEVEVVRQRRLAVMGTPGHVRTVGTEHGRPVAACRSADGDLLRRVLVETLNGG